MSNKIMLNLTVGKMPIPMKIGFNIDTEFFLYFQIFRLLNLSKSV